MPLRCIALHCYAAAMHRLALPLLYWAVLCPGVATPRGATPLPSQARLCFRSAALGPAKPCHCYARPLPCFTLQGRCDAHIARPLLRYAWRGYAAAVHGFTGQSRAIAVRCSTRPLRSMQSIAVRSHCCAQPLQRAAEQGRCVAASRAAAPLLCISWHCCAYATRGSALPLPRSAAHRHSSVQLCCAMAVRGRASPLLCAALHCHCCVPHRHCPSVAV